MWISKSEARTETFAKYVNFAEFFAHSDLHWTLNTLWPQKSKQRKNGTFPSIAEHHTIFLGGTIKTKPLGLSWDLNPKQESNHLTIAVELYVASLDGNPLTNHDHTNIWRWNCFKEIVPKDQISVV